jgi:pilus assembly protein CpaC
MWKRVLSVLGACAAFAFPADVKAQGYSSDPAPRPVQKLENNAAVQGSPNAVAPPATVLLKVSMITISLSKLRSQGVDLETLFEKDTSGAVKKKTANGDIDLFGESSAKSTGCHLLKEDDKFFLTLKDLIKDGAAEIRAQPKLVTQTGRAASFSSGGEIPVPVPQSAGTITIEWKKYGTIVDFVPFLTDRESINLEFRATLSELDDDHSITVSGTTVPGLNAMSLDTALKVKTDQIAVMTGNWQSRAKKEAANAKDDSPKETAEAVMLLLLIKPEIVEPMK